MGDVGAVDSDDDTFASLGFVEVGDHGDGAVGVRHEVSAEVPALTPAARDMVGADDEEGGIRCRIRKGAVDVTVVDDLDRDREAGGAERGGEGLEGGDGVGVGIFGGVGLGIDDGDEFEGGSGGAGALDGPREGGAGFGRVGAGGIGACGVGADTDDDERGGRRRGIRLGCRGIRHGVSLGGERG
ncbi:hypothetical protein GCM10009643_09320 [Microbacterium aurantiacum]